MPDILNLPIAVAVVIPTCKEELSVSYVEATKAMVGFCISFRTDWKLFNCDTFPGITESFAGFLAHVRSDSSKKHTLSFVGVLRSKEELALLQKATDVDIRILTINCPYKHSSAADHNKCCPISSALLERKTSNTTIEVYTASSIPADFEAEIGDVGVNMRRKMMLTQPINWWKISALVVALGVLIGSRFY